MTERELRKHYERVYKTLRAEKSQRQDMLARHPHKWKYWNARIEDAEQAMQSLIWLKDQLKPHAEPDMTQGVLLEGEENASNGY